VIDLRRFYEFLYKIEMAFAKYALLLLALLVFAAAVARTIRHPINWAIDLATFLFAWCVFIGGDIAMRKDKLFSISLLTGKLSDKGQLRMMALNYAIILAFLVGMAYFGVKLAIFTHRRTFQGIPGFSYTWVTLSVPVGCALMAVTSVHKIREFLKAIREGGAAKREESSSEII
jgi:TRAP-type C4-dicarboxylate transport system permease small subunit